MCAWRNALKVILALALSARAFAQEAAAPAVSMADPSANPALQARFQEIAAALPPAPSDGTGDERQRQRDAAYAELVREKLEQKWFAALVSETGDNPYSVRARFDTWRGLLEFLQRQDALVEVWAYTQAGSKTPRRIPATELNELRRAKREQPHYVTATFRDAEGSVGSYRIEFGFEAPQKIWEAHSGYRRHRDLIVASHAILDARDDQGRLSPVAQWSALSNAVDLAEFEIASMPAAPKETDPLFVAFEFSLDGNGNFLRAERVYTEDDITPAIEGERSESRQILKLRGPDGAQRVAEGFRARGLSDELEPARNTLVGQDEIELRIRDAGEKDPRKWAALEFGAPQLIRRASMARFALINAQMERRRKEVAVKKSKIDLFAEPIIAGLNIGGGIAGLGLPAGEIGRVLYNMAGPRWIPKVPSVAEMREVFAILAARSADPVLSGKPVEFLTARDITALRQTGRQLTDDEVQQYLQNISDRDIEAMIRLARMGMIDARVTNFINLLTSVFKVTEASEQAGIMRDIFNNVRFAPNGDINLKTLIALAAGKRVWTPLTGVSLYDLSRGNGPSAAWAQFFEASVDFRAVANSVTRWFKPTLAKKELERPFPYATRLGDLAAYEFRAFGFPLLLFYKRGLIKADLQSYENDYAYGVIGTRIVVRYPSKQDMEREILAGRLFPLGLVRVPDGKGGWKETNLPVFANRIETGRHKGKIALVIYGLPAYRDYSELMDREWARFQKFETVLREGGVIERVVEAENRASLPPLAFEPRIAAGETAGEEKFAPLLAGLLEMRRAARLQALGLPLSDDDLQLASTLRGTLAGEGFEFGSEVPLVEVDKFSSALTYRRLRRGQWETVKVTRFPSRSEIAEAILRAEESMKIAEVRRAVAAGETPGAAFFHSARLVGGRYEAGPLLAETNHPGFGPGLKFGAEALAQVFSMIETMPVVDRARLVYNRFAATLVDLDLDSDGAKEKVFLSVEFPLQRLAQARTNPATGQRELVFFESGRPMQIASPDRWVEFSYNEAGAETETRVYWNAHPGALEQAAKGPLLQSTRTLQTWQPDFERADLNPYQPVIKKLKLDYVTGQATVEEYGLFPLPVRTIDEQFITTRKFDERGRVVQAVVVQNGADDAPAPARLANPQPSAERFRLTAQEGSAGPFQTTMLSEDLVRGLAKIVVFDNARQGRPIEERFDDGAELRVSHEYDDQKWFGVFPFQTRVSSLSGSMLREVAYVAFDPVTLRTVGIERDYRGGVSTQTWDSRWSAPIQIETPLRRTTFTYNRLETAGSGQTVDAQSGELIRSLTGTWQTADKTWQSVEEWFHSPGVPLRRETNWLSGHGRLLRSQASADYLAMPVYDSAGRETERRLLGRNPGTGALDVLLRSESDYAWNEGRRVARVRRYVDGRPYDEFESRSDAEGRVVLDGSRTAGPAALSTSIAYDGGTERRTQSISRLGGQMRSERLFGNPEQREGAWILPVVTLPAFGLAVTNLHDLGDPLGRASTALLENGSRLQVTAWFPGTDIPRTSELINAEGRATARWTTQLGAGQDRGLPYDLVQHQELSPWGTAGLKESRAIVSGTDLLLFKQLASERIYFDFQSPSPMPRFARRSDLARGIDVQFGSSTETNVSRIFGPAESGTNSELAILEVDLLGLFQNGFRKQVFDQSGNLLREESGFLTNRLATPARAEQLLQAASSVAPAKSIICFFEPGWWKSAIDSATGVAHWSPYSATSDLPFNRNGREFATRIEGREAGELRSVSVQRRLSINPWLPHISDHWTEWTTTNLAANGAPVSQTVVLYNAQGIPVVSRTIKGTAADRAEKISIQVPAPAESDWSSHHFTNAQHSILLADRATNIANSYFFCFFARAGDSVPELAVTNSAGKLVSVNLDAYAPSAQRLSFWPVNSGHVLWSPSESAPREGIALSAPSERTTRLWAVPVASLRAAGVDLSNWRGFSIRFPRPPAEPVQLTPLHAIVRPPFPGAFEPQHIYDYAEHSFSSGLRAVTLHQRDSATGADWKTIVQWNGLPVLAGWQEGPFSSSAKWVLADYSDPAAPRPLYALDALNGHFLQWFQMFRTPEQTRIYSVVNGFESPRLEVFRSDLMSDELRPSALAYGKDVPVMIPRERHRGPFSGLRDRLHASAFKYAGDQLFATFGFAENAGAELDRLNRSLLVSQQPSEIARLPILAEAILPFQTNPWADAAPGETQLPLATNVLAVRLKRLSTRYPTALIPTTPDSDSERFVNTELEGELVQLAIALGSGSLAAEILDFYWDQSRGGSEPLFDWYDATTGASVFKSPFEQRPIDARRSARSQLSIAEAALHLNAATGDTNALHLGQRLLQTVMERYRPLGGTGLTEEMSAPVLEQMGYALLPPAARFSLGTNARFYQLLRRVEAWMASAGQGHENSVWRSSIQRALRQQELWLRENFLDHPNRLALPSGAFQLQDIATGGTALAQQRWTASDDWLSAIEAADLLGAPRAQTRQWLEHLARAHGARSGQSWGLDWTLPVRRPEAISTRLTARFFELAQKLEHSAAANFAREQLARMTNGRGELVAVVTSAAPNAPLLTGSGPIVFPDSTTRQWPAELAAYRSLLGTHWTTNAPATARMRADTAPVRDMSAFFWTAALFYLAILAMTLFWWALHYWRRKTAPSSIEPIVPAAVMQRAEERWARRVLGVKTPPDADRSRFSNGPVEENFHIQLRAIYKLVLEWRRIENGWEENDPRLVEHGADPWLNGMDEFAAVVGIYSRWVVKAGKKDGFPKPDPFDENEDSNHIWARLVLYLSEYLWGLLQLLKHYRVDPEAARIFGTNEQIESLLRVMGARARPMPFDGRVLFDCPANPEAMDILPMQLPGATLRKLAEQMEQRLRLPVQQFRAFLKNYKSFKHREQVYPIHPYIIEAAKLFPHFMLMGLVSVIWYNQDVNGLLIYPYLKELGMTLLQSARSLWWAIPLLLGWGFAVAASYVHHYRYIGAIRTKKKEKLMLDAEIGSLLGSAQSVLPAMRPGWQWDPVWYERAGWILRGLGLVGLAVHLMDASAPSLATFMLVKGLFVPFLAVEAAAILVPLVVSVFSRWLEDRVSGGQSKSAAAKFVNQLNLVPTRPASILWLSLKYHFQASLPSGGWWPMLRCIGIYLVFTATFFLIGSYSYKEVLRVWFAQRYHQAWDWELAIGSLIFWNTMYLLRFGLFVLFVSIASFVVTFPLQAFAACVALAYSVIAWANPAWAAAFLDDPWRLSIGSVLLGAIVLCEPWLLQRWERSRFARSSEARRQNRQEAGLADLRAGQDRALAVVYMSGDDLSFLKLTPDLLLARLKVLREKLGSEGASVLFAALGPRDDATLSKLFEQLYALEKKHDATLWHPMQLVAAGETPRLKDELGLNLHVASAEERETILETWQIRRWLVTMMSTAGHGQDTGINLVDIALRLNEEGLARSTAFYLIQNKYDNADNNRPSQMKYGSGELGHRNKLAHLLMQAAPGARAYSINDWTPFGFKAGGMVGMDFIHEETLKLSNMLVLDRNANTHDLANLMQDLKGALSDPGVIIVVPGRSTTNALTPIGQASQLVEEGHRALLKGVMAIGGAAGESVGTGWGNIQAISYAQVQRALLDPNTPKMPLTSRMSQGSGFHEMSHGLIGFGPHAVGISEDIWGVTQASHNALALGRTVKFRQSRAFWHKIRETWSHAEWFSAFPRWSGGYVQLMLDPLMQRINDFGPLSVFAKELRANCGRFFLSVPFALLNILLMPLAIIYDVSPFVQILVVLWLFGLVMNQVLTMLGLVAYLESSGFKRLPAILGSAGLGAAAAASPASAKLLPAAILAGLVGGGFATGLSKWLFNRGRDLIVFGPQLVIHALGQLVRQSLEFVLSGASADDAKGVNIAFRGWVGPREDRPWEGYANIINMRTVIWGVGLLSLLLNLFALSQLDFLNSLLLLPSLFFSISTLIGPFLMAPKRGPEMGMAAALPKLAGWASGFILFVTIAMLGARPGLPTWIAAGLFGATLAGLLARGLRYVGYARRVQARQGSLARLIENAGLAGAEAQKLATQAVRNFQGDPAKLKTALAAAKLDETRHEPILAHSDQQLRPLLKQPVLDVHGPLTTTGRWRAEFSRSFALSLFTLIWFLLVPLPGLLVFSGLGYRVSVGLPELLKAVLALLLVAVIGYAPTRIFERLTLRRRIQPRLQKFRDRFKNLARRDGALSATELSTLFATFTDAVTYSDQRAYAYAARSLDHAEELLARAEARAN